MRAIALLSAVALTISPVSGADFPPDGGRQFAPGVLVLRNGETLQGQISLVGDKYIVAVDGGELFVRASEVDACAGSYEALYQDRRARTAPDDVVAHLQLALWCKQHGLANRAAEELAAAKALDPRHPMLPLTERRLQTAPPEAGAVPPPQRPAVRPVETDDLEALVRGMPPGTVETFAQTVQPLLVNRCAAAGCHGPGAPEPMRLERIPPSRMAVRRLTQQNLRTVLRWIDRNDPAASPLLTAPLRAHGPGRSPVFTDPEVAQYRQLVAWVARVTQGSSPGGTTPTATSGGEPPMARNPGLLPTAAALQLESLGGGTAAHAQGLTGQSEGQPDGPPTPPQAAVSPGPQNGPDADDPLTPRPVLRRGNPLPQLSPRDPFDPETFNRQFAPAGK